MREQWIQYQGLLACERRRQGYVYLIQLADTGIYKIGRTKDMQKRLEELQRTRSASLTLVAYGWKRDAYSLEQKLHRRYDVWQQERRSEWYALTSKQAKDVASIITTDSTVLNQMIEQTQL